MKCDPDIVYTTPVETDFHTIKRALMGTKGYIRTISPCAICANTTMDAGGGKIYPIMLSMYSVVLPICDTCKSNGAKTIVGLHTHNGKAIQERMDQARRRESLAASS